jgi:hypothetical protein
MPREVSRGHTTGGNTGKGRTGWWASDRVEDIATEDAGGRGSGKCRHDGKHGDVQEQTMMEKVLARENLLAAWRRVKANAGAPGIDGMPDDWFTRLAGVLRLTTLCL